MKIATNEKLFSMTCQLWKEAYCHGGESLNDLEAGDSFKWHPYGAFDCSKGYMVRTICLFGTLIRQIYLLISFDDYIFPCTSKYIDRIGFRLPTNLAEQIGKDIMNEQMDKSQQQPAKKSRPRPIQRSLTPHFDCCPETYHDTNKSKWRPIQCFVSLTDNIHPNTGGFEAAPGFHREFRSWTENGRRQHTDADDDRQPHPLPCVGEYTHINPTHDREILDRVQHIAVKAGCAVFWDNRIPHGNAYRNVPTTESGGVMNSVESNDAPNVLERSGARAVVYCSFLPDVNINRSFVERQLLDWKCGRSPRVGDRWIKHDAPSEHNEVAANITTAVQLTDLGSKLIGLNEW